MVMPKDQIPNAMLDSWRTFLGSMEKSLDFLEKAMDEAVQMTHTCTHEWCEGTEHVIDELGNILFAISEPRWSNREDSSKLKRLKRRVRDVYADYKALLDAAKEGGKQDEAPGKGLPFCTTAPDPEHERAYQEDEPCDDYRAGP